MGVLIDLKGQRFGRLLVIGFAEMRKKHTYWNCVCDCGNTRTVALSNLKGNSQSCGCYRDEYAAERRITHGMSNSLEFSSWSSFRDRCNNPKNTSYKYYKGRGITYCERWDKFENFFEDMGERPSVKYSLDRIDNNKGYYKENCRWATSKEQGNNKRNNTLLTVGEITLTISQWSDKNGINKDTISSRIKYGWSIEDAVTKPKNKYNRQLPFSVCQTATHVKEIHTTLYAIVE